MAIMMLRRKLRLAALAALGKLDGVAIDSPGDWDTPSRKLPALKVRTNGETKLPLSRGAIDFTTTVVLEVKMAVEASTAEAAQDELEDLGARVEDALYSDVELVRLIQQVSNVTSQAAYSSEAMKHIASMEMAIALESFEAFEPHPEEAVPLEGLDVFVDSINVYDTNGNYTQTPFPSSVQASPRTAGPDGRAEGGLNIELT